MAAMQRLSAIRFNYGSGEGARQHDGPQIIQMEDASNNGAWHCNLSPFFRTHGDLVRAGRIWNPAQKHSSE
jgi:hypothetical protein